MKYCPIAGLACNENGCGLWDNEKDQCSMVSIAQGANQLEDVKQDLFWIRRVVEDNR
jgi:hypothetical protein